MLAELQLSEDQKNKIADIGRTTTSPMEFQRQAFRLLNKQQRTTAVLFRKRMLEEHRGAMQAARAKREEKLKKYFPGQDLERVKQANKIIHEQREARLKAAVAAGQTPPAPHKQR